MNSPGAPAGAILRMKIQDEFTAKPWPKWKKRQARLLRDGRCQNCKEKVAYKGSRKCLRHLVETREYQRARRNCKRRYWSASYKLEQGVREEAI